ncbi:site-specific integrase [Glycomyces tenuis]|uniref:site-specific integrase n=1 Tax=Glycomyces tenuis TaxID=58116 RepID=UPI00040BE1A6|nr:site-specific integrase [Glycomyces tenuis]
MAEDDSENRPKKKARHGDGTVFWDKAKGCYVGQISLGYKPDGTRLRPKAEGRTKKEVHDKLKRIREDHEAGLELGDKYTVEQACRDFLKRGLPKQGASTVSGVKTHLEVHIIPGLGKAKLKRLSADDVDDFLAGLTSKCSTSYIGRILGTLRRVIRFAQRRNKVARNVAELVEAPKGKAGRPSKALTLEQGKAIIRESHGTWLHAYIAVSMFTGVRTEEARPLKWAHTHLNPIVGEECSCGAVHREDLPPHIEVWRSVRVHGDTKNETSRRTVALPAYVVDILTAYRKRQIEERKRNGHKGEGIVYVFGTRHDTVKEAKNVRRYFKAVTEAAEIEGNWVPRELRHTFVSWMSDQGASDELIADLVGHKKTSTTRTVYRHQLRPVITKGSELLDKAFGDGFEEAD